MEGWRLHRISRPVLTRFLMVRFIRYFLAGDAPARLRGRKFTVHGAIDPADAHQYYSLPPDTSPFEKLLADGEFFTLYGPRGAGKTTTGLRLLRHAARHRLRPVYVDCSSLDVDGTPEKFWKSLCDTFKSMLALKFRRSRLLLASRKPWRPAAVAVHRLS